MFKRFRAGIAGAMLVATIGAIALLPSTATAEFAWSCPAIPWSPGSAPAGYGCADANFPGGGVYAVSHVQQGFNYGMKFVAASSYGVPYRLYLFDNNTSVLYGPWLRTTTAVFTLNFPSATNGHVVIPVVANNSTANQGAHDYNGSFLGCDVVTTCIS